MGLKALEMGLHSEVLTPAPNTAKPGELDTQEEGQTQEWELAKQEGSWLTTEWGIGHSWQEADMGP